MRFLSPSDALMGLPGLEEQHGLEESIDHGQHLANAVEVPIHVAILAWLNLWRNELNDLKP
jgi:hypothetical protein